MKPEEAREYVIRHCNPDYPNGKTEWETAINMAIDALEKQIPMKIGPKVMDCLGRARPECGNCGEIVEDSMWSYCPWCGQGIGGE